MQGIYAGTVDTKPNRDRNNRRKFMADTMSLWVIEFNIEGQGKGTAICRAENPMKATQLLERDGMYQSVGYKITKIEEVSLSPCSMLLSEQVVTYKEVNNEL